MANNVSAKSERKLIKLAQIVIDEDQPRQKIDNAELEELRQSALTFGPVTSS